MVKTTGISPTMSMKEKIVSYPAVFKEIEKDVYFVKFPDVDGAFTEGHGLKDAFEMASDVLATMLYDSKRLPKVSNPASYDLQDDEFVAIVQADLAKAADNFEKTVRKNVTIPYYLAKQAEENHINFSQLLTQALKTKLS